MTRSRRGSCQHHRPTALLDHLSELVVDGGLQDVVAVVKLPLQDHDVFDVLDLKGVVPFAQSSHGCSLNLAITFVGS